MAVIENSINFGGVDSAEFGIFISGEGVFNAPKRAVEVVSVPGRNGDVLIDQGHWENIEITYPAFNYEPDMESFRQALSDFRNAICSKVGYQRLTDTFHPDEYRMAAFIDDIEIKPISRNTAAQFEIKFNAKPQRWLTSGEEPVLVEDGDTVTNPTPYEAGPLLAIEGYGTIGFNGYEIDVENAIQGEVYVVEPWQWTQTEEEAFTIDLSEVTSGEITVQGGRIEWEVRARNGASFKSVQFNEDHGLPTSYTLSSNSIQFVSTFPSFSINTDERYYEVKDYDAFIKVTGYSDFSKTASIALIVTYNPTGTLAFRLQYSVNDPDVMRCTMEEAVFNGATTYSEKSILGHPTYIDCDLGDAYKIENERVFSLNSYVDLGSKLPRLAPGGNEITCDNTITELQMQPKWWKL